MFLSGAILFGLSDADREGQQLPGLAQGGLLVFVAAVGFQFVCLIACAVF